MLRLAACLLALMPAPVLAQLSVVAPVIDVSGLAAKADVHAAQSVAQQAKTVADSAATIAAAAQAAIPQPATTVGQAEMVGGYVGSSTTYKRGDWVPARITRTAKCAVTLTAGIGSCTAAWDGSSFADGTTIRLTGSPAVTTSTVGASTEQPITCKAYGISTSGISFRCWQAQSSLVSILGQSVFPFAGASSGVFVEVTAIPSS